MVSATIYCEIAGSPHLRTELKMIQKVLSEAVPTIKRETIGPYTSPQSIYGNEARVSLLQSVLKTKSEVKQLRAETRELARKLDQQAEEIKQLQKTKTLLQPLQGTALAIRRRFFATFRRVEHLGGSGLVSTILGGNKVAHDGDVVTDICLFRNGLIDYRKNRNNWAWR